MVVRKLMDNELNLALDLYCDSFLKEKKNSNLKLLGEVFGVFLDDELMGMVQFDFIHHIFEDKKILYINGFCIKNSYRNQGYGDKLLKWCISFAKGHQVDIIQLTSNKTRIYAHQLYEKNGFEIVNTTIFKKDIEKESTLL